MTRIFSCSLRSFRALPARRAAAMLLAALAVFAHAADEPPADETIELRRVPGGIEIHAEAQIAAAAALVWETLTDYERLPNFIPGITRSAVLERRGARVLLEQAGELHFLFFTFPIAARLEVLESPPGRIASHSVGGNLRSMSARYEIHPGPAPGTVVLVYAGTLEPDFELPPLIGMAALRSMVRAQFRAMVAEIRRRASLPFAK